MIPGMDRLRAKPTPVVKHLLAKNEGDQMSKNDLNCRSVIGSQNLLTKFNAPQGKICSSSMSTIQR